MKYYACESWLGQEEYWKVDDEGNVFYYDYSKRWKGSSYSVDELFGNYFRGSYEKITEAEMNKRLMMEELIK